MVAAGGAFALHVFYRSVQTRRPTAYMSPRTSSGNGFDKYRPLIRLSCASSLGSQLPRRRIASEGGRAASAGHRWNRPPSCPQHKRRGRLGDDARWAGKVWGSVQPAASPCRRHRSPDSRLRWPGRGPISGGPKPHPRDGGDDHGPVDGDRGRHPRGRATEPSRYPLGSWSY